MNKKLQRELNGPSWTEVIFGAVLSLALGVVLAAAYLVLKPVETVRELPKEPAAGVVYFIEGSRNAANAREVEAKQRALIEGGSAVLNEEELNVLTAPPPKPKDDTAAPAESKMVTPGALNFRIRESVLQVGLPLNLNVQGLEFTVILQTRGGFVKKGDTFAFVPDEFYLGSCPLQRLPFIEGMLIKRIRAGVTIPAELTDAWRNLSGVVVEGKTLRLTGS
jgi:hypothetical protein